MAKGKTKTKVIEAAFIPPLEASASSGNPSSNATPTRRNIAGTIDRTDRYTNITNGLTPFRYFNNAVGGQSTVDVRDAVILCQKAFYNFYPIRNIITLMAEFCTSDIYFKGSNKKAKDFFEALFKKINLKGLQERFFLEFWRSGNVFIYRYDSKLKDDAVSQITKTFAAEIEGSVTLPARYIILNPADIQMMSSVAFINNILYKVLTDYELNILRNPKTKEDQEIFDNLPPETKKQIKTKSAYVLLVLDATRVYAIFNKKQDYEPFAVPMCYPVLEDINWKAELKKMDMAVTRTMQQVILLVTMGAKPDEGGINPANMVAMQKIFESESIGRVLVADWTTKAQFIIPDIAAFLDPKKYEVVDRDIQQGLNNILVGDEKFANQNLKIKVFIERLKRARESFLNDFLIPEIRRISDELGFQNFPTPYFEDIDLKDEIQYARMITQLLSIGVLTPEEGFTALQTGVLPDADESVESQQKLKDYKDKGMYQPLIGGPFNQMQVAKQNGQIQMRKQMSAPNGRPSGIKTPQSTKNIGPLKGSFSLSKITENFALIQKLQPIIEGKLLKKNKVKKLNDGQKDIAAKILEVVVANEEPKNWEGKLDEYVEKPVDKNPDRIKEIQEIALEHQVDDYLASILYSSKI